MSKSEMRMCSIKVDYIYSLIPFSNECIVVEPLRMNNKWMSIVPSWNLNFSYSFLSLDNVNNCFIPWSESQLLTVWRPHKRVASCIRFQFRWWNLVRGHQIWCLVDIYLFSLAHNGHCMIIWCERSLEVCQQLHTHGFSFNIFDFLSWDEVPNSISTIL